MSFENYECDEQMSISDLYPNQCCGVIPWLHQTKCWMDGRDDIPQRWIMYYQCPKCGKVAIESDHWTIRSSGTFKEAAQGALKVWNDQHTLFEEKELPNFPCGRAEEFEKLYGIKWEIGVRL